ncbi:hypothetical protein BCR43DRAFT_510149 [Syncephalastrum racemosum]|uniref:Uncharacterized protein n=1 Tax=Syncephalastrum racemosum TaxID=13706 RepID=A0A1X2HTX0_SYNRA|nr:hypothetical protein BCR43DRAFT_510149 [Syncephalastrum racemosum]
MALFVPILASSNFSAPPLHTIAKPPRHVLTVTTSAPPRHHHCTPSHNIRAMFSLSPSLHHHRTTSTPRPHCNHPLHHHCITAVPPPRPPPYVFKSVFIQFPMLGVRSQRFLGAHTTTVITATPR